MAALAEAVNACAPEQIAGGKLRLFGCSQLPREGL